ncbi:MAG: 50S ribosomal protein L18 [Patescibacteria group bacterium]
MKKIKTKKVKRKIRSKRIRSKISGTKECPRLSVFRSNKHIYLQLINDDENKIILQVNDGELKEKSKKTDLSEKIGELMAKKAKKIGVKKVIFDKGGYKYHGRVKAAAEGARKGGLEF